MRFAQGGAGFVAPGDNPVQIDLSSLDFQAGFGFVSGIDMRAYQSYILNLRITGPSMADTDVMLVGLLWSAEPFNGATENFQDLYTLYPSNAPGSNVFYLTDVCHGSYLEIYFVDSLGAGYTANIVANMYGSYRPVSSTFVRSNGELVLYQSRDVGMAGGSNNGGFAGSFGYGRGYASLLSGAGGGARMEIQYGGNPVLTDSLSTAVANTRVTKEIIMPRQQMLVTVFNTGAGVSTIDSYVIQQLDPY